MKGKIASFAERRDTKPKYDNVKYKWTVHQYSPNTVNSSYPKGDEL